MHRSGTWDRYPSTSSFQQRHESQGGLKYGTLYAALDFHDFLHHTGTLLAMDAFKVRTCTQ